MEEGVSQSRKERERKGTENDSTGEKERDRVKGNDVPHRQ